MYAPRQEKVKASCPACQATVTSWHEEDLIEQKPHRPRTPINLGNPSHKTKSPHRALENDMSKPDWTEAPEGATHYDCNADVFCTVEGWWHKNQYVPVENKDWGTDRYTPRPVEAWFPIVGERCQVIELPGIYIECEILAKRCGDYITTFQRSMPLECWQPERSAQSAPRPRSTAPN